VGLRFNQNEQNVFYGGINHTGSVIKKTGLNPLNNLQAKWHITGGWQRHFSTHMFGVVAISYIPDESKRYVNDQLPLGRESEETFDLYSVLFEVNYRWPRG
jgi:long-chain fatty acid transport protein